VGAALVLLLLRLLKRCEGGGGWGRVGEGGGGWGRVEVDGIGGANRDPHVENTAAHVADITAQGALVGHPGMMP
jgi:hypothetical protein